MTRPGALVMNVASKLKILFTLLEAQQSQALRESLIWQFGTKNREPIWQGLETLYSYQDTNGWRTIARYVQDKEFVLFFDPVEDDRMLSWLPGTDFEKILSGTVGFTFYITNCEHNFLICFNDHDFVISSLPLAILPSHNAINSDPSCDEIE